MLFDLAKTCSNMCPFRTDCLEGWLGEERALEIADSLVRSAFPCHKTTQFDDEDGEHVPHVKEQHCAGALIVMEKMGQPSQMVRIAERLRMYDRNRLDMFQPVFDDLDEFVAHHA